MSIRVEYPNPFLGTAAYVGAFTTAYNQGRINSENQQAQAQYQARAIQNQYDSQLYSQLIGAGTNLAGAAIFAPILAKSISPSQYTTPDFRTYNQNVAQGKLSDFQPGNSPQQVTLSGGQTYDVSSGPGSFYPAGGPGDVNTSIVQPTGNNSPSPFSTGIPNDIARGIIAASVLDNIVPGTGQLGQIPLQQYLGNQRAAQNFAYDQRAADADLVRRRGFFDYTRAARNEDEYVQNYGVTPEQTRTIGEGLFNGSPPNVQSTMARHYGYSSPNAIGSLPQAERDSFYGSVGLESVRMRRAQEAIQLGVAENQQQQIAKRATELQTGYESGNIELDAPYETQYRHDVLEPEADLRRAIVNGDLDGYDANIALQDLASKKGRFFATLPPKAYKTKTSPQDIANEMVVEHPKKKGTFGTLKIGRNGQREVIWDKPEQKQRNFANPQERDADFELNTKRDSDGNIIATFNPKEGSWKPTTGGGKSKESASEPPKLGDVFKMYQDFRKSKVETWKSSAFDGRNEDDPGYGVPVGPMPSEEEMQSEFEATMGGAMSAWQKITVGADQFNYTRKDIDGATKVNRDAQAKAIQEAQMMERVRNARPEQLIQLGIDPRMSRFHPDNVAAERQTPQAPSQQTNQPDELAQIRAKYRDPAKMPPEVRRRAQELIKQRAAVNAPNN